MKAMKDRMPAVVLATLVFISGVFLTEACSIVMMLILQLLTRKR